MLSRLVAFVASLRALPSPRLIHSEGVAFEVKTLNVHYSAVIAGVKTQVMETASQLHAREPPATLPTTKINFDEKPRENVLLVSSTPSHFLRLGSYPLRFYTPYHIIKKVFFLVNKIYMHVDYDKCPLLKRKSHANFRPLSSIFTLLFSFSLFFSDIYFSF